MVPDWKYNIFFDNDLTGQDKAQWLSKLQHQDLRLNYYTNWSLFDLLYHSARSEQYNAPYF